MTPVRAAETPTARRGGRAYFIATIVAQVSALLRYVVLARLLGPEQLGLASALVITMSFFDLISDTGSDRFLIQNRDGDAPAVQKLVQLVYVGRGALIASALVLAAWPLAYFYKEPRLAPAIMVLALCPLILGFTHLDIRRVQRHLDFRSEAQVLVISELLSLCVTTGAAFLTHSFTAILYGLIVRALVMVLVSQLRAERPYRLGFSQEHAGHLARFSLPLMANGVLLFLGSQGDRVLVANRLSLKDLGYYSAISLLIYYPAGILTRYVHAMYLPLIARHRDDQTEQANVTDRLAGQTLLLSAGMAVGFAVVAPTAVVILYGHRFAQSVMVIALIGILQACRYMVVAPTTIALSAGRSGGVLTVNAVRLVAYPCAIVGGWTIGGLAGVTIGFIAGEALSLVVGTVVGNRAILAQTWWNADRLILFAVVCVSIVVSIALLRQPSAVEITVALAGWGLLALLVIRRERHTLAAAVSGLARFLRLRRIGSA